MTNVKQDHTERYQNVRAAFILDGTSFNAWCKKNSVTVQNARKALLGQWTGAKAAMLVDRILLAANMVQK